MRLIPIKATFAPQDEVEIEVLREAHDLERACTVQVWHLDRMIASAPVVDGVARFGRQAVGGYGLTAVMDEGALAPVAHGAFDVLESPFDRPRYGFVAEFNAGRGGSGIASTARSLHLNLIQFYDWAHRYAQLVPDTDEYVDPLGRVLSITTVREMTQALSEVGSRSMGYAAVYAVGGMDWEQWKDAGLFKSGGEPHRFTDDLLLVVDPANERWMAHFIADLDRAMREVGFNGFHLDSYGWPKRAFRADGSVCDLNVAFPTLLERIRTGLPLSEFMFNNVNDFPTWSTAASPQNATYIEVWAPHTDLGHLGALVQRARGFGSPTPPILAAYLSVYGSAPRDAADNAARLVMATIFSHGGTHLLNGEDDVLLIDPYYPKNLQVGDSTRSLMRDWYDFLVRYGDLLLAPEAVDVTRSYTGGINEDLMFDTPAGISISTDPEPGRIWVRVVRSNLGLVVHLINLVDQTETAWDKPKQDVTRLTGIRLRMLRTLGIANPMFADPDEAPMLQSLPPLEDGEAYEQIDLPPLGAWTMVVLPEPLRWPTG